MYADVQMNIVAGAQAPGVEKYNSCKCISSTDCRAYSQSRKYACKNPLPRLACYLIILFYSWSLGSSYNTQKVQSWTTGLQLSSPVLYTQLCISWLQVCMHVHSTLNFPDEVRKATVQESQKSRNHNIPGTTEHLFTIDFYHTLSHNNTCTVDPLLFTKYSDIVLFPQTEQ